MSARPQRRGAKKNKRESSKRFFHSMLYWCLQKFGGGLLSSRFTDSWYLLSRDAMELR